ncbi:hypothetical protein [Massilia cavernae]|uniref:3-oxoacyl-ACP synthase n=1 Tax=Massilia cavernae TaxID=2320864 RepID=A0A418XAH0_9BURK|nr:hypothetical protein [Massilia cavernae]RJG09474.1 hypothetical protein D3872_22585 [Massilia cavernae]
MISTTSLGGSSPIPGWLKGSLLAVPIVGVCWAGAIWHWRSSASTPDTIDLLLYLVALPAGLLLAFWIGRQLTAARPAAPVVATAAQPAMTAEVSPGTPPLAILAASIRSPLGTSPEELAIAIADNKARADLDPDLVDGEGFPLMTARSDGARDDALQEEITEWLVQNSVPEPYFNDEQWRAITLATAVAGELASHAAGDLIPAEGVPTTLHLVPILPPAWRSEQRRAAGMWLKHTVAQFGWPAAQITLAPDTPDGATPAGVLGRLANQAAGGNAPVTAIVLACASHIGEESVAQWAGSASLFTPSRPHGLIPGEGAAGLLVTDLRQARAVDDAVYALVDQVCETQRDSSADDSKRTDSKSLGELAERALKHSQTTPADVAMIVADTGHRSNRALELMGFASAAMPQLDAAADIVSVGVSSGTCGAVPFITALALARHHVLERDAPILCISNEDPVLRGAVLLRPAGSNPN